VAPAFPLASVVVGVKDYTNKTYDYMEQTYNSDEWKDCNRVNIIPGTSGLCEKYNQGVEDSLKNNSKDDCWILFTHDDVELESTIGRVYHQLDFLGRKKGADIVCVAGNLVAPSLDCGFWWQHLGKPHFKGSGAVMHMNPNQEDSVFVTSYGPYPAEVKAFDGLWFAVKNSVFTKKKVRFDEETFDGFHYYEADFGASARAAGCKMWTSKVMVCHKSLGEGAKSPEFNKYRALFTKKWSKRAREYYGNS